MGLLPAIVASVALSAAPAAPAPAGEARIAVLAFETVGAITPEVARAYSEKLLLTLHGEPGYREIGMSDLEAVLGYERMKDILGCEDTTCLAELAGAAGVDLLLTGTIVRDAQGFNVMAKIVDAREGSIKARVEHRVSGETNALFESAADVVRKSLGRPLRGDPLRAQELQRRRASKRLWGVAAGVIAAAALGSGTAFVYLGYDAKQDADVRYRDYASAADQAAAARVRADVEELITTRNNRLRVGYPLLGLGLLAAALSIYEIATMPAVEATVTAGPTGADGAVLTVRWSL